MNTLESFIESLGPGMWLSEARAKRLVEIDRLHPVLVRCDSVRFTCGAQYLEAMIGHVSAGGDYVRDCSLPAGSMEHASKWAPGPNTDGSRPTVELPKAMQGANPLIASLSARLPRWTFQAYGKDGAVACFPFVVGPAAFDEGDYGGAFDGFQVTSDADPGL